MRKNTLLSLAIMLSALSFSSQGLASPVAPEPHSEQPAIRAPEKLVESGSIDSEPTVTEPIAMIVAFPQDLSFDISESKQLSTMLILAQPLINSAGELLAPVNSPVQATLVATDEGARIQVESVVSEGSRIVPVQAISPVISFTEESSTQGQKAGRGASIWGRRGLAIGCLFNNCSTDNQTMGGSAGAFLGSFIGESQSDSKKIVQIPQGSVYILQVSE